MTRHSPASTNPTPDALAGPVDMLRIVWLRPSAARLLLTAIPEHGAKFAHGGRVAHRGPRARPARRFIARDGLKAAKRSTAHRKRIPASDRWIGARNRSRVAGLRSGIAVKQSNETALPTGACDTSAAPSPFLAHGDMVD